MQSSAERSPGRLRGKVGCQGRDGFGVVAGVVGKLDSDWLRGTLGDGPVQLLDGALGLNALVKPNETHTFGKAWKQESKYLLVLSS